MNTVKHNQMSFQIQFSHAQVREIPSEIKNKFEESLRNFKSSVKQSPSSFSVDQKKNE